MPTSSAGGSASAGDPELALRLRVEALIEGAASLRVEEAMAALADVESVAAALAATGAIAPEDASTLVAAAVDALVVRGAAWVEPAAADLDVRRLYDVAAGAPRPQLRAVVGAGVPTAAGLVTTIDLWADRAEARLAGPGGVVLPSLHLDAVGPGEDRLVLRDDDAGEVVVELTSARATSEGGTVRPGPVDAATYLARLEAHAAAVAGRESSPDTLNGLRRRLVAVGGALGDEGAASRFDAAVGARPAGEDGSTLVEVVPVAVRTPWGWLLAVERWTDHWRVVAPADGSRPAGSLWSAADDAGATTYGGEALDDLGEVLRFDPPLPPTWSWATLSRLESDGTVVDVDVVRR